MLLFGETLEVTKRQFSNEIDVEGGSTQFGRLVCRIGSTCASEHLIGRILAAKNHSAPANRILHCGSGVVRTLEKDRFPVAGRLGNESFYRVLFQMGTGKIGSDFREHAPEFGYQFFVGLA
jgi:hypothetical protein